MTPPMNEMEMARQLIYEAWTSGGDQFSGDLIKLSENYYDSAMICWQNENAKIFFTRDYESIKLHARKSAEYALKARDRSTAFNSGQKLKLRNKLENLKIEIDDFNDIYSRFPLPKDAYIEYDKVNVLYSEAEQNLNAGQHAACEKKIVDAGISMYNTYRTTIDFLKKYFANYPDWQRWAWSTIDSSIRNVNNVILVDKFSRELYIYNNGVQVKTFKVELGPNWIGDKRQEGDRATPEGFYRVVQKLDSRNTKFYKALLINYPNESDMRSFNREKENGTLPASSRIGGAIEIHGAGGSGRDWTNGCIALKNSDMDIVYDSASAGTMVTIVGSLKSFDEIMRH